MVSPLQTWQHPEPKRLWWALGGLSVLVHVGVLGLSLPYLLDLMVAGGAGSAAIAPPIELVLVDPADTAAPSEETVSPSEQAAPSANEDTPEDPPAASPATAEDRPSPERPAETNDSTSSESSSEDREQLEPQSDSSTSEEGASDTGASDTGPQPATPGSSDSSSAGGAQSEETSDELPFLGGAETLPDPSESIATGDGTESSFAVSVVGHSPPPEDQQYDLKDTFPSVSEAAGATSIPLQRQADCEWFNFSQQQWTYRVAVAVDGSIAQMSLLTAGGDEREGEAIACLIERSALTLIPAQQEGEAVYDDNLILTIEITKL